MNDTIVNRESDNDRWLEQLLRQAPVASDRQFRQKVLLQIQRYRRRRRAILGCTWLAALAGLLMVFPVQQASLWLTAGGRAVIDIIDRMEPLAHRQLQLDWSSMLQGASGWGLLIGLLVALGLAIGTAREF